MDTKLIGRSRKRKIFGKSRRQFASIINNGTHKCIGYKLVNNACVLDNQGKVIAFTTCRDVSLPQFK